MSEGAVPFAPTEALRPRRAEVTPLIVAGLAGAAVALGAAALLAPGRDGLRGIEVAASWAAPGALIVLLLSLAAGAQILRNGYLIAAATVVLCGSFRPGIEAVSLDIGFFKIYAYDVAGIAISAHLALRLLSEPAGQRFALLPTRLTKPLLFFFVLGTLQAIRAVALGIDPNDALGDFRRGYVYLLVFLFPLLLPDRRRAARALEAAFCLTALGVVAKGFAQIALQQFDRRAVTDAAHILNQPEAIFCGFLAFYCMGHLLQKTRYSQRHPLALFATLTAALTIVILSNFRSVWLALIVGTLLLLICLPPRFMARALTIGTLAVVFFVLVAALLWDVQVGARRDTLGAEVAKKVNNFRNYDRDMNVIWRYQSYKAALDSWREHPLLGSGLGTKNSFISVQSDGSLRNFSRHRTHDGYLWVLQTTGLVGLAFFLWLHAAILFGGVRDAWHARRRSGRVPPIALAVLGYYGAFMTVAAFDVILETSSEIILLMLALAATQVAFHADAAPLAGAEPPKAIAG